MSQPQPRNFPNAIAGQLHIDATDTTRFGVYSTGTVKKYIYGTRYRIGDRVFHYGKSSSILNPKRGAFNEGRFQVVTGGNVTARVVGDTWLDIKCDSTTGGATWFGTKNNMVGGMYVHASPATNTQFRMITGHEKGANNATIKVYLDGPLTLVIAAAGFAEIAQNPYSLLGQNANSLASVMGVPTTNHATGAFGWFQSWGPCFLNPHAPVADTANWRTVVFRQDGSCIGFDDAVGETGHQVAGFVIDNTFGNLNNPPFIFLQISPF